MTCKRCGREVSPWPLGHKGCSPKHWALCITTDDTKWESKPMRAIIAVNDRDGATLSVVEEDGRVVEFARIDLDDNGWLALSLTNSARSGVVSERFMGIYPSKREG